MHKQSEERVVTLDSLFDGRLSCRQYESGYRFSVDAVLVSHFCVPKKYDRILDLGTGCGIIGLILLYRHQEKQIEIVGLEKQSDLVKIARENAVFNNFTQLFDIIHGDVKEIRNVFQPETFSLVIVNPPFYIKNSGRLNTNRESRTARHQDDSSLSLFLQGAFYCLRSRGRVVFIYPANLVSELMVGMKKENIEPKRARFIYSYPEPSATAKLVLIEGVKNGGNGITVEGPLYIYNSKGGTYSDEMVTMYKSN